MPNTYGAYIVAWDFSNGEDSDVLIVGEQKNSTMNIVNAFQGKEARDIYEKLSTVKKVEETV
jgi:hypothetical protein